MATPGEQDPDCSGGDLVDSDWFLRGTQEQEEVTALLNGKTGSEKSTVGNLLYGVDDPQENPERTSKVGNFPHSETQVCKQVMRDLDRCRLTVVDIPGIRDTSREKTFERFDELVSHA